MKSIGFIGAGNMATALVSGIVESGLHKGDELIAFDIRKERMDKLKKEYGVVPADSNLEVVEEAQTVMLCIKPQSMEEVLNEIKGHVHHDTLVITIAAGITIKYIEEFIGSETPIIRVMPNTPALIKMGVSAISGGRRVTDEHMRIAAQIFSAVGETVIVNEELMDAVTAISGSGPGYFFRFMEALVDAGVRIGIDRETCLKLVLSTGLGATKLATQSDKSLKELREMVTSPGGTTEAALRVFNERGFEEIIISAIESAHKRAKELGGRK